MSKIHDNIIKSYFVDFENGNIVFNTVYYCNNIQETTIIKFYNVMDHLFINETKDSVIFDIDEYTIEEYIKYIIKDDKISNELGNYDFPFTCNDEKELIEKLNQKDQKYYIRLV